MMVSDIRVRRRSHQRHVSWGKSTIHEFMYSDREKAGGDQAWVKESARSSTRKGESVFPRKPEEEPVVASPVAQEKSGDCGGYDGDSDGDEGRSTEKSCRSKSTPKSSPRNPLLAFDGENNSGDSSSTLGTPASASKPVGGKEDNIRSAPSGIAR